MNKTLPLLILFATGATFLTEKGFAQTSPQPGDPIVYGDLSPNYDILSELTAEFEADKPIPKKEMLDLDIKASRLNIDLNSEKQVEFSAKSSWAKNFVWKFGDGTVISGFQHVKHKFTAPGTYNVILQVSDGEEIYSKSLEIKVVDNSKPLELEEMEHYVIFPHDNKMEAEIQLNLPRREKNLQLEIQDCEGNKLMQQSIGRVKKQSIIKVDMQDLADGKYYAILKGKKYSLVSRITLVR
jgi:hypothetical protein